MSATATAFPKMHTLTDFALEAEAEAMDDRARFNVLTKPASAFRTALHTEIQERAAARVVDTDTLRTRAIEAGEDLERRYLATIAPSNRRSPPWKISSKPAPRTTPCGLPRGSTASNP